MYAEDFRLVAEILSPSNTRGEIDLKLRRYREAVHNLYVVVIEPREISVEIYTQSRAWQPEQLTRSGDVIELPDFGVRGFVGDLYRGTPLAPR